MSNTLVVRTEEHGDFEAGPETVGAIISAHYCNADATWNTMIRWAMEVCYGGDESIFLMEDVTTLAVMAASCGGDAQDYQEFLRADATRG